MSLYAGYQNQAKKGKTVVNSDQDRIMTGLSRNIARLQPQSAASGINLGTSKRFLHDLASVPMVAEEVYLETILYNSSSTVTLYWGDVRNTIESSFLWNTNQARAVTIQANAFEDLFLNEVKVSYSQYIRERSSSSGVSDQTLGAGLDFTAYELGPLQTQTVYLKIDGPWANGVRSCPLNAMTGAKLETNLNCSINCTAGTPSDAVLQGLDVIIYGWKVNEDYAKYYYPSKDVQYVHNFYELQNIISVPLAVTAGQYYEQRLYTLNSDNHAALVVIARPQSVNSGSNTTNFLKFADIQIRKNATRILLDQNLTVPVASKIMMNDLDSYYLDTHQNIVVIPLSDMSEGAIRNGVLKYHAPHGLFDSNCTVYFSTSSYSGNIQIEVYALTLKQLTLINGHFDVQNAMPNNS